jgi:hypothetical protein
LKYNYNVKYNLKRKSLYTKQNLAFQNFQGKFKALPGKYEPPDGVLILAFVDGEEAGCVALHKVSENIWLINIRIS